MTSGAAESCHIAAAASAHLSPRPTVSAPRTRFQESCSVGPQLHGKKSAHLPLPQVLLPELAAAPSRLLLPLTLGPALAGGTTRNRVAHAFPCLFNLPLAEANGNPASDGKVASEGFYAVRTKEHTEKPRKAEV